MTLALEPGSSLLHYRVVAPIGAGGMGEVYKALDTTLGREVAIKVLPTAVAGDAERLARFDREARLLASMNHPNIAAVYGLHTVGAASFLAMELVPGEDLATRLDRGPLAVDEALTIARQIADALAAAHDSGVVHRDLKPANVRLTPDGRVKVLDFGLAKGMETLSSSAADLAHSPTLSYGATVEGVILGTAGYMSPEQARGRPVDRRTDVWAFGCVVWEMLTGERLFVGETVSDTIAALLRKEIPWSALPAETPPAVVRLLRRCLERDPARRLRDLGDARLELDEPAVDGAAASASSVAMVPAPAGAPSRLPWAVAAIATLVALAALLFASRSRPQASAAPVERPVRFSIASPPVAPGSTADSPRIALSPKGDRLFWITVQDGRTMLVSRALGELETTPIPGSDGIDGIAAVAPDGSRVAIVVGAKIEWLPLRGGAPKEAAVAPIFRGATLGADGTLWYSRVTEAGISRVGEGESEEVIGPDAAANERSFRWPAVLPDGVTLLYTVATAEIQSFDEARIEAWSAKTGKRTVVVEQASFPLFVAPDRLLFARRGALFEARLDLAAMKPLVEPHVVADGIVTFPDSGLADVSVAADGTLAWVAGPVETARRQLIEVNRDGRVRPIVPDLAGYQQLRVSPDGKSIAVDIDAAAAQIWIYDRARGTRVRLTQSWSNNQPVWSRDGQSVFYFSGRGSRLHLFEQRLDGGAPVSIFESDRPMLPNDVTPDGSSLLCELRGDVVVAPRDGSSPPEPVLDSPFIERDSRLSPDGRWLVFVSNETGRAEVYLRPYPGPGRKLQVSTAGGDWPVWNPDGREIVFVTGAALDEIVAAPVTLGPSPDVGRPRLLYRLPGGVRAMDMAPDGKLVAAIKTDAEEKPPTIVVARGWEATATPPR